MVKKFENKTFDRNKIDNEPEFDLVTIYEKCIDEMTLQQAKRDQIITIYLAMFSFVVSYILPNGMMNFVMKDFVFFSGETIYCLIHAFIVSVLFGIGFFFITSKLPVVSFVVAGISGVIFFLVQIMEYFKHLIGIYRVLVDDTSDSFNNAFSKAWFLHLYVE